MEHYLIGNFPQKIIPKKLSQTLPQCHKILIRCIEKNLKKPFFANNVSIRAFLINF